MIWFGYISHPSRGAEGYLFVSSRVLPAIGPIGGWTVGYNDFNNLDMQTLWWLSNKFFLKFNMGVKKRRISRWFRIRWKSFEKRHHKKFIGKNVTEKALFFHFLLIFVKFFLLIIFVGAFLYNFFNGFEISGKFCVFRYLFWFFLKHFFWVLLALFANFEAQRARNSSKNQKTYLVNVS